jgi:hypothetical protein
VATIARICLPRNGNTPMPIPLSQPQFLAIPNAAALCPSDRDPFIAAVAAELAGHAPVGDGSVGRAIREVQGRFAHPEPPQAPARWQRERPSLRASKRAY